VSLENFLNELDEVNDDLKERRRIHAVQKPETKKHRDDEDVLKEIVSSLIKKAKGFYSLQKEIKITEDRLSSLLLVLFEINAIDFYEINVDWSNTKKFAGETLVRVTKTYKTRSGGSYKRAHIEVRNPNLKMRKRLFDLETNIYFIKKSLNK